MERHYYAPNRTFWQRRHHLRVEDRLRSARKLDLAFYKAHPQASESGVIRVVQELSQQKAEIILADACVINRIIEWAQAFWTEDADLAFFSIDTWPSISGSENSLISDLRTKLNGTNKRAFVIGQDQSSDTTTEPIAEALREAFPRQLDVSYLYFRPAVV